MPSTTENASPAARLKRPRQRPNPRHALSPAQLDQINGAAAVVGPDPDLDVLVLRLLTETACRRSGSLGLRRCDVDETSCTLRLREKGVIRDQPVTRTLMKALVAQFSQRNPDGRADEQLLRSRSGAPLSRHYFEGPGGLWSRLARQQSWITSLGVTSHWLRYTTLTWVERNFGYAVAATYGGHVNGGGRVGNTYTYVQASLGEVATALAALTGEPHSLDSDTRAAQRLESKRAEEQSLKLEAATRTGPIGALEAVVQRRTNKDGRFTIGSHKYSLGRLFGRLELDIHVYDGRYLVKLPDGTARAFPRRPDGPQVQCHVA